MPAGLRWSKENRRWVPDTEQREIYYDGFEKNARSWGLLISWFRWYPDKFLDMMEGPSPKYQLEPIQRMFIRAFARYEDIFLTASRGTTKSYCGLSGMMVVGALYPGIEYRYFGPSKEQLAQIVGNVYDEVIGQYPGLEEYWHVASKSKDNFEIVSNCGSVISIKTNRGDTCNAVFAEESAQAEKGKAFDHDLFRSAILPACRGERMVNRRPDPFFPQFQKAHLTSAGTTHNESFEYRSDTLNRMQSGNPKSFAVDVPSEVAVLSRIRKPAWRDDLKSKLTSDGWLREMDSIWTGATENPLIRDSVITASKNLMVMEDVHCGDPNIFYVIGYDVSYADGAKNAKCATVVVRCERQEHQFRRTRYMKSVVYACDNPPPPTSGHQARYLKNLWRTYSLPEGAPTYIAIDGWQYGKTVVEGLHEDMNDGLHPLCCMNHEFIEIEKKDALPLVYAIKATSGSGGSHDSDADMIRYAETEFEQGNIRLLTSNVYDGVEAYKKAHNIKTDELDAVISRPYNKTREMVGQIANLRKKPSGMDFREERASKSIQRDMWSALKYALRVISLLEYENLAQDKNPSVWAEHFSSVQKTGGKPVLSGNVFPGGRQMNASRVLDRKGGNIG
jgi:hypothetical protein